MPSDAAGAAPSSSDAATRAFVCADEPLGVVEVSIDGLRGRKRRAAAEAGETLRGARTLGDLDGRLRNAASSLAIHGEGTVIEVSPGKESAGIRVTFRQQSGACLSADAGLDEARFLEPAMGLRAEFVDREARGPLHMRAGGLLTLSGDAFSGTLRLASSLWRNSRTLPTLVPAFEITARGAELTRVGPLQKAKLGAFTLADTSGRHTLRFEVAARELCPRDEVSEAVWRLPEALWHLPMRTSKASVGYRFFDDKRPISGTGVSGQLWSASAELAGLLGDVAAARLTSKWAMTKRLSGGGIWNICVAGGLMRPLGSKAVSPLEDRFHLGGSYGCLGERFPGFAMRGVGSADHGRQISSTAMEGSSAKSALNYSGGDARLNLTTAFQWPLPRCGPLQGIAVGSVGSLVEKIRPSLPVDLIHQVRGSVGVGVGVPLPWGGFLGLVCSQPVLARQSDQMQRLQVWLSFGATL
mmetsp:Transcript_40219/g.87923  ORF Transcript_40219/g.87923 Transcript_40219/m.87923 type:complete len:469 (-) Transcript_40219:210-1616(-)